MPIAISRPSHLHAHALEPSTAFVFLWRAPEKEPRLNLSEDHPIHRDGSPMQQFSPKLPGCVRCFYPKLVSYIPSQRVA